MKSMQSETDGTGSRCKTLEPVRVHSALWVLRVFGGPWETCLQMVTWADTVSLYLHVAPLDSNP